jgi:threonine dehydrogenase-like Zn-dependent dehydrogenase
MKAIAIIPGTNKVHLAERPEVTIRAPDEIKLRVLQVGICGTDREETSGGRARAPDGQQELVIGHEMFGQVVDVGKDVQQHLQPGDYAIFTVRRGCAECLPCRMNRPDMCLTGNYRERGIWGLDGYQTEYVVDKEAYIVQVSPQIKDIGVLCEPLSIAEKAIDEAVRLQFARNPDAAATPDWLHGRRCLVAGLGPVGLLAAVALRLRGAQVFGLDIVDQDSARPQWLSTIGGQYIDGRQVHADKVDDDLGPMELIFEATGVASLTFNLLDALATNGVYVVTGIPGGDRPLEIPGAELIRQLVLENQAMVGSVNASRDHFQMAVDDLTQAHLLWPEHLIKLITQRYPYTQFASAFSRHPADEIKAVIDWTREVEVSKQVKNE